MAEQNSKTAAAQQTELAIGRVDSLSLPGCVAAQLFAKLLESRLVSGDLAEVIESEPALAARLLALIHKQGLNFAAEGFSVGRVLDKLPAELVRDGFLSAKVAWGRQGKLQDSTTLPREKLILHSIAVGCCARDIAKIATLQVDPRAVYFAGLLHDIGKLALCEAMPKSFARIVEEARAQGLACCVVEQKHLGLDHTILGRRLAERWHLPQAIVIGIWLHHSAAAAISAEMSETGTAQIVQLADCIVRQLSVGESGSYDAPGSIKVNARAIGISPEQIERIGKELAEQVEQKAGVIGLDMAEPEAGVCNTMQLAAVRLSRDNAKLSEENQRLQVTSSRLDFLRDFLLGIDLPAGPITAAEDFAVRWQKFYQTGKVCLYLVTSGGLKNLEAVLVENLSQSRTILLNAPADCAPIPEAITKKFAILDARDHLDWLFEQLDTEFDARYTRVIPLLSAGRAVGAIVFELRYPTDAELFEENFRATASVAGVVLDMASQRYGQQRLGEKLVRLIGLPQADAPQPQQQVEGQFKSGGSLRALAEMAGGAAHELNNPLTRISGQSQLLAEGESDPAKKEILEKIKRDCRELSLIIEGLMDFAEPEQPRATNTNIRRMLDEATQLTAQKTDSEQLDIEIEMSGEVEDVFVDSAQIASAIANIFSNSVESYEEQVGPIKVAVTRDQGVGLVKLEITDFGCGMDAETVRKAAQPFFSAKPAGRKRGMGLAYAVRLIESNGGSLNITSKRGEGTTVIILLPCK